MHDNIYFKYKIRSVHASGMTTWFQMESDVLLKIQMWQWTFVIFKVQWVTYIYNILLGLHCSGFSRIGTIV